MPRPPLLRRPVAPVLLAGALLAGGLLVARDTPSPTEPPKQPNEWFHFQRAWPAHDLPQGAYARALRQARALAPERGRAVGGEWQAAGPTNVGGRVTAIAVDPTNASRYWIGAADGGVLRTTDAGNTWTPLLDDFGGLSVGALAHHPSDPGVLLCGTGEANTSGDSYDGVGILKTTDGGDTWTNLGLPNSQRIAKIAWDATNPARIWVAVAGGLFSTGPDRGVYRSTDSGATWSRVLFLSDMTSATDVVVDPTNGDRVYAAMWDRLRSPSDRIVSGPNSGIWRSTNGGDTWVEMTSGVPTGSDVARIGLAVAPSQPSRVYAVYSRFNTTSGTYLDDVYRSDNFGTNWSAVSNSSIGNPYSSFGWYFGQIRVSPTNPSEVYVLGVTLERSTDGGVNWSDRTPIHVDQHDLWINPAAGASLIAGHDGGVDTSVNSGASWSKKPDLPITQFYAITVDPQLPHRIYGGTQDNSTPRTLTGALDDWDVLIGGDGFTVVVDPTNSNTIYGEYQYGGLSKATDGSNFFSIFYGAGDGRANWHMPFVMHPTEPQTLYAGTYRVHRTTNGGNSWSAISPDLTDGAGGGALVFGTLTTLALAPSAPSTIYSGADDGSVWVTTNGGSSWSNVEAGLPVRWVTRVAVDPGDDAIAYVTHSGYREDVFTPHVFRTTNHGTTWADISGNLPNAPANDLIVDPQDTNRLYVATDVGVYTSADLGGTWTVLGSGLPLCVVADLELHDDSRALVAGTHGRSAFTFDLTTVVDAPVVADVAGGPSLEAPFPNPTADRSLFAFTLPRAGTAHVSIHDVTGRRIRELRTGEAPAGRTAVTWDGTNDAGDPVAAGVYFARLEALGERRSVKVSRLR
ncbi:MAG: T9SS type A sorting domain-containing protein [Gemmatimonadetes bacterium]|nr:T9SS type A sorting domain-containing protein [Gemmatimonadota bacterium]